MKKLTFAGCIAAAAMLSSCAADPQMDSASTEARPQREYTTGSNIGRRSGEGTKDVTIMSREEFERMRQGGTVAPPSN